MPNKRQTFVFVLSDGTQITVANVAHINAARNELIAMRQRGMITIAPGATICAVFACGADGVYGPNIVGSILPWNRRIA